MFDGDPATPRTEGSPTTTQFLAHVYCGQTAGWMKTPLGTEVDLGPGHIVLDGDPASPPLKGHSHPIFRPYMLRPNGCECRYLFVIVVTLCVSICLSVLLLINLLHGWQIDTHNMCDQLYEELWISLMPIGVFNICQLC